MKMKIRSGDIHGRSPKLFEIAPNFACLWPADFFFFWGGGKFPKFSDLDYKTEHTSDRVATFHVDRQRARISRGENKKRK